MMVAKTEKPLSGFLNVLKPPGMTSAQVVGFVRRLTGGAKIGHAGTLDPEAAGVLPLMLGKATRLFDYMQDKEKTYVAEVAFGCSTDTQDAQGVPLETSDAYPTAEDIEKALGGFRGMIWQEPPMYSALKQDGQRLYELAREGKQATIPAREVTVHELSFNGMTEPHGALVFVRCSKGFYVRTLCHDLGWALNCPAHMRFLLRTASGVFTLDTACTLEALEAAAEAGTLDTLLIPMERVLAHLPHADVPQKLWRAFRNGGRLDWQAFPALHDTEAAVGKPAGFWVDGRLYAIGNRKENEVKLCTWLAENEGGSQQ